MHPATLPLAVSRRSPWPLAGAAAAFSVIVVTLAGAYAGGAAQLEYGMPLATLALACAFLHRRRDVAYLEFVLWLWLASPLLRRVVDYQSSFHEPSAVLVAPYLAALLCIPGAWRQRQAVPRLTFWAFTVSFACIGFAALVGLALNSPTAVLASLLTWLPPLAIGFFLLMSPAPWSEIRTMLIRVVVGGLLVLGLYGIVQWALVPAWDADWLDNVRATNTSFGNAEPFEVRIWSLFNGPGPFATLAAFLVIATAGAGRTVLAPLAVLAGLASIAIAGVRAAWIALLASAVLLAWRGGFHVVRVSLALATLLAAVFLIGGPAAERIEERADTFSSGASDTSAAARISFQAQEIPRTFFTPLGNGMGSTGAGVRAGGEGSETGFQNPDSGYLEALRIFGPVAGILLLGLVLGACVRSYSATRDSLDPFVIALAAAVAVTPISMLFGSAIGLTSWLALGALGRPDVGAATGGGDAAARAEGSSAQPSEARRRRL